jgi:multidrug efflux pump subunit AcrA (membrane-fusion protein)
MSSLEVDADVAEANITRVNIGQPCEIRLDAYPDQAYQGEVSKIVPTADRAKATVLVKIRFGSYDRRVLPEMSAKVSFLPRELADQPGASDPVLSVPSPAVAMRNGRRVVYHIKEDRAVEVPVTTGRTMGELIEIKDGIKEGDRVISKVDDQIQDGVKIVVTSS